MEQVTDRRRVGPGRFLPPPGVRESRRKGAAGETEKRHRGARWLPRQTLRLPCFRGEAKRWSG